MNILKIYETVKKIGSAESDQSEEYQKGFSACLYLFKLAFSKNPAMNLHIQNSKLSKTIIELENKITLKELELSKLKDNVLGVLKPNISDYLVPETLSPNNRELSKNHFNYFELVEGFTNPWIIRTSASKELVEQEYSNALINLLGDNPNSNPFKFDVSLYRELKRLLSLKGYKITPFN